MAMPSLVRALALGLLLIAACEGPTAGLQAPAAPVAARHPSLRARTGTHEARWLVDPAEALAGRVQLIRAARRGIDVRAPAWTDDPVGRLLAREFARAEARGVEVRVLAGSPGLLLVDGRWAIVGPRELGGRCLGAGALDRERELLIAGPVLTDLAAAFEAQARDDKAQPLPGPAISVEAEPQTEPAARPFQGLVTLPYALYLESVAGGDDHERIAAALTALWAKARQELIVQGPDLNLSPVAVKSLATDRARRTDLMLSTDSLAACADARAHAAYHARRADYLGAAGARLFELRLGRHLHGSAFIIDATIAGLGGYDLDPSAAGRRGAVLVVWSDVLAQQLRQSIAEDIAPDRSWVVAAKDDPACFQLRPEKTEVPPDHPSFAEHYERLGPTPQADPAALSEPPAGSPHSY